LPSRTCPPMRGIDMTTDHTSRVPELTTPALANLQLGTAPDSWGVWFPDDPQQVPWHRFLDEAAAAGYTAVELGPFRLPAARPPSSCATSSAAVA
jgi:hypothetical protein